jgi:hypothetical protein
MERDNVVLYGHFIDTIKLIAYRAETALAQLAREKLKRFESALEASAKHDGKPAVFVFRKNRGDSVQQEEPRRRESSERPSRPLVEPHFSRRGESFLARLPWKRWSRYARPGRRLVTLFRHVWTRRTLCLYFCWKCQ